MRNHAVWMMERLLLALADDDGDDACVREAALAALVHVARALDDTFYPFLPLVCQYFSPPARVCVCVCVCVCVIGACACCLLPTRPLLLRILALSRPARCEVRGARCEVRGARYAVSEALLFLSVCLVALAHVMAASPGPMACRPVARRMQHRGWRLLVELAPSA